MQLSIIFLVVSSHLTLFALAVPIFTEMKNMGSAASSGDFVRFDENPTTLTGIDKRNRGSLRGGYSFTHDDGGSASDESFSALLGTSKDVLGLLVNAIPLATGGGGSASRGNFGFDAKKKVSGLANGDIGRLAEVVTIGADDGSENIFGLPISPM